MASKSVAAEDPIIAVGKRDRSPNHPLIDLKSAIEKADILLKKTGSNPCNVTVVAGYWEMKPTSSGFLRALGALEQFGLVESTGSRNTRAVVITDPARRILRDQRPDSQDRFNLLQKAALLPPIHQKVWNHYGGALPDDQTLAYDLQFTWKFTESATREFIKQFKATIQFAKLSQVGTVEPEVDGGEEEKPGGEGFKVGDYVQWEPNGIMQFAAAKRISSLSADGAIAFVDGNGTGLPVGDLVKADPPKPPSTLPASERLNPPTENRMRQDIFSINEGTVTIQWPTPLSSESIQDLKDWLKIVERKITRSVGTDKEPETGE